MEPPLVSVVIPAYNAERYVLRAIRGVQNQTHENIEIMVVDDGSDDRTRELVLSVPDPRLRYIRQDRAGQGLARNRGMQASRGSYVTLLDADDQYLPEKVGRQVALLEAHPEWEVAYCGVLHFYSHRPQRLFKNRAGGASHDVFGELLRSSFINPNAVMLRRTLIDEGFIFRGGRLGRFAEEWELLLRIAAAGHRFGYVPEDLVLVEVRPDSYTQWDIQWLFKEAAIEILEDAASSMSEESRDRYGMSEILRRHHLKLVVSYVIDGQMQNALDTLAKVTRNKIAHAAVKALFRVVPVSVLRRTAKRMWMIRRRLNEVTVASAPPAVLERVR